MKRHSKVEGGVMKRHSKFMKRSGKVYRAKLQVREMETSAAKAVKAIAESDKKLFGRISSGV
jgi:hypothetical protein